MRGGDQRTHVTVPSAFSDANTRHESANPVHQLVGDWAHGDNYRDGHAALACRAEASIHSCASRQVKVGIGEDDHVILSPTEGLNALAVPRALLIDILSDWRGSHERNRFDVTVLKQGVHRLLVSVNDVEDAAR